jgi:hypothetical protein
MQNSAVRDEFRELMTRSFAFGVAGPECHAKPQSIALHDLALEPTKTFDIEHDAGAYGCGRTTSEAGAVRRKIQNLTWFLPSPVGSEQSAVEPDTYPFVPALFQTKGVRSFVV